MVLRTFVALDKETLADMKYQSEKYAIIIEFFSYADKISSFIFVFIESFLIPVIFIRCDQVFI